jgi:branched-chain amino acid aminotransferase
MGNSKNYIFKNGSFILKGQAIINIEDSGFMYGDGFFETLKAHNGVIFLLDRHLERLFSSLEFFKYPFCDYSNLKLIIKSSIKKLLHINHLEYSDAYIKIIISRGRYKSKFNFSTAQEKNVIILAESLNPYSEELYKNGIHLIFSSIKRSLSSNILYRHKMINYFENIYAKNEAILKDANEAIFLSEDNYILEGAVSNIFLVKDSKIFTSSHMQNILLGITREEVLLICAKSKILVYEKKLKFSDFTEADEIFITNSIAEVLPVKSIESFKLQKDVPGSLTKSIMHLYKKEIMKTSL